MMLANDDGGPVDIFEDLSLAQLQINTSRLKFNRSLKSYCLDVVIDSFRANHGHKLDIHRIAGLPSNIREEILKRLVVANKGVLKNSEIPTETRCYVARHLISGIHSFNFKLLEPMTKDELKMDIKKYKKETADLETSMFQELAKVCATSLQSLVVGEAQQIYYTGFLKRFQKSFRDRFQNLLKMKRLCHLELHQDFLDDDAFGKICESLVMLKYLKCNLLQIQLTTFTCGLHKLTLLEIFCFIAWHRVRRAKLTIKQSTEQTQELTRICLVKFPRLKVVGCLPDEDHGEESLGPATCFSIFSENIGNSNNSSSMLQHMRIEKPITHTQVEFHRNITALAITYAAIAKLEYLEPLLKLKKIKSLVVYGELSEDYFDALMNFLSVQGPFLEHLQIQSPRNKDMIFSHIFSHCPQLKTIKMCPAPELPNVNIDNLTEIHLCNLSTVSRPYVIIKLFTACSLRILVLNNILIDTFSVTEALIDIVMSAARVAPKLASLKVSMHCVTQHVNDRGTFTEDIPVAWVNLMMYILCKAPLLSDVTLNASLPELSHIANSINQRSQLN